MLHRPIARSVLADQVRSHLLAGIVSGRYPPDSRIVETRVARELGISQAPVREALRVLEGIGMVEISPFRGARVRRPSRREILETYTVRAALETQAARLAITRLTDGDIETLLADGAAMEASAADGDGEAVAEADARLHATIVSIAGNQVLERSWRWLEPYSRTYLSLSVPGADPTWSANLHRPILEAIRRRDGAALVEAIAVHFTEAADNMSRRWPEPAAASPGRDPEASSIGGTRVVDAIS
jgi:DNA-binding GntR family transcriptional regulator